MLRTRTYGNHGDQRVGACAEDREIGGVFISDEQHGGHFAAVGGREAHGGRSGSDRDGFADAAIEDVDRHDASGSAIGDVHFGCIGGSDGSGGG